MKFFVDVNKLPRPERSGVISILVMYVLLTGISDMQLASYPEKFLVSLHGWQALICWLMPCSMLPGFYYDEPENRPRHIEPWHQTTRLVFGGAIEKEKKKADCYWDVWYTSGYHQIQPCDDYHDEQDLQYMDDFRVDFKDIPWSDEKNSFIWLEGQAFEVAGLDYIGFHCKKPN